MRHGIGYLRVSSDEQARSGLGVEAQRMAIVKYAADNDITVVEWQTDAGLSGGKPIEDRPGLAAVIDSVQRGTVVLIAKRDRLARETRIASAAEYMIERRGGVLVAVEDGDQQDEMTRTILNFAKDLVATMERLQAKARMRATWAAKRARGETMGTAPQFGKKLAEDGRTLVDDEEALSVIREIVRRYVAGVGTVKIANWLNESGVKTTTAANARRGLADAKWQPSAVNAILRREGVTMRKGRQQPKWIGQYNLKLNGGSHAKAI